MRYDKLKKVKDNPQAGSSASTTTFINSTLPQSAEGQRTSAQDITILSPTASSHEFVPLQESEPIGPRARARPRAKGKGKEKDISLDNTHPSEALQLPESSSTPNLMDVSEETITTAVTALNKGSHEPVSKPRPRPRPKAKGKASATALLQSRTLQSNEDPKKSGTSSERQSTTTMLVPGSNSTADTLSTVTTKRKAVNSMDGSRPKRVKASHTVEPPQSGSPQSSQIPPASISLNDDGSSAPQLGSQPKKPGRPRKVRPQPEQQGAASIANTPAPLISTTSETTSLRRTRAQTRAAQRLESSS
jgi:hypothetical protein